MGVLEVEVDLVLEAMVLEVVVDLVLVEVVLLLLAVDSAFPVQLMVVMVVLKVGSTLSSRAEVVIMAYSKYMCLPNQRTKSSREDLRKSVNYLFIKLNQI